MSKKPKLTHYVSEIDQFLQSFDKSHPELSLSQQKEQEKYRIIYFLRDIVSKPETIKKLWNSF